MRAIRTRALRRIAVAKGYSRAQYRRLKRAWNRRNAP